MVAIMGTFQLLLRGASRAGRCGESTRTVPSVEVVGIGSYAAEVA